MKKFVCHILMPFIVTIFLWGFSISFADKSQAPPKIGLILATGGLGDRSFNDQSYWGASAAAKEIATERKAKVEAVLNYVEPTSIAEYEGFQRDFAGAKEYSIIVCVGFDQAPILEEVAPDYPDQKFVVIDAVANAPNVASILFNDWEEAFLCGVAAGMMTKRGKVGIEGGMDIPLIHKFVQGFTQGVLWVNQTMTKKDVLVRYVGAWDNPSLGKELALEIYASADIIYGAAGKSHLGVFAAAKENKNRWAIGTDVDQAWSMPEHADIIIASGLKRVALAVKNEISKALKGTWKPGIIQYGIKTEMGIGTGIAIGNKDTNEYIRASKSKVKIPSEIIAKLVEAVNGIKDGKIVIEHE
ncbi:BMP family ABC transporter substrate-binding protein [Candidatus Poribacteria bacterium]|nr:BMP family ABC transporter substrate-binding protein [Candidatus Poribacteria bacterium]